MAGASFLFPLPFLWRCFWCSYYSNSEIEMKEFQLVFVFCCLRVQQKALESQFNIHSFLMTKYASLFWVFVRNEIYRAVKHVESISHILGETENTEFPSLPH